LDSTALIHPFEFLSMNAGRIAEVLAPLTQLAGNSPRLSASPLVLHDQTGRSVELPRFLLCGPEGGGDRICIGIFAGIHGDEPGGIQAINELVEEIENDPSLVQGYQLFFYPICNPSGFVHRTRCSSSGKDLNREFWTGSLQPEVRALETEIWTHAFHGIITLHSDDTSRGLYGFVDGAVLSGHLLEPALLRAEKFLPRDRRRTIDGFPARRGIIHSRYNGALKSPQGLKQPPFEITFETPQEAPLHLQAEALNAALEAVLTEYRYLVAVAQNI